MSAGGPLSAQAITPEGLPRIVGTSVHLEDLLVMVEWPEQVTDLELELVLLDADHRVVATQPLRPISGSRTQTSFADFLHRLPESGPQFFATIRDADGSDVSPPHTWRGVLDCPHPAEPCRWATHDGLYTDALSLSQSLGAAIDSLEADRSSDLLADVLERRPDLRGPIFSLAAQLDLLDQHLDLKNDCFCAWYHSSSHSPDDQLCGYQGPGKLPDGTGREHEAFLGPGAQVWVAAQARKAANSLAPTATASSQQTMELRCWKVHRWLEKVDLPLAPNPDRPQRTIRFPIIEPCPDSCRGTVESSASLGYQLTTGTLQPPTNSAVAIATVYGSVQRDSDAQPSQVVPWDAWLQWTTGVTLVSQADWIHLPAGGVFVDADTRLVTTTLTGTARASVEAKEARAWSYGAAAFMGGLLRARGQADCALLPTREAELETWHGAAASDGFSAPETDDCGEPQIEPWED